MWVIHTYLYMSALLKYQISSSDNGATANAIRTRRSLSRRIHGINPNIWIYARAKAINELQSAEMQRLRLQLGVDYTLAD